MWIAVVPAHNEENSIARVMENLVRSSIDKIVLVANGCSDNTCEQAIRSSVGKPIEILSFPEQLGIDVPRAAGAAYACSYHPKGIVFVDGDMKGEISYVVSELLMGIESGLDLALTNCYPFIYLRSSLANTVLKQRELLNRRLGLFNQLGVATPSHGPHAVSAKFLQEVPVELLAIPPLALAFAAQKSLSIGVAAAISHNLLGSSYRNTEHAKLIAETIIGDCQLALSFVEGKPLNTIFSQENYNSGYQASRRFDLLQSFLDNL
ncbi:MAG: glycosyl transferase [Peptococcaceae bacterium]|nr:glycosyl transferase [Peptococcaceae bacterium]